MRRQVKIKITRFSPHSWHLTVMGKRGRFDYEEPTWQAAIRLSDRIIRMERRAELAQVKKILTLEHFGDGKPIIVDAERIVEMNEAVVIKSGRISEGTGRWCIKMMNGARYVITEASADKVNEALGN